MEDKMIYLCTTTNTNLNPSLLKDGITDENVIKIIKKYSDFSKFSNTNKSYLIMEKVEDDVGGIGKKIFIKILHDLSYGVAPRFHYELRKYIQGRRYDIPEKFLLEKLIYYKSDLEPFLKLQKEVLENQFTALMSIVKHGARNNWFILLEEYEIKILEFLDMNNSISLPKNFYKQTAKNISNALKKINSINSKECL